MTIDRRRALSEWAPAVGSAAVLWGKETTFDTCLLCSTSVLNACAKFDGRPPPSPEMPPHPPCSSEHTAASSDRCSRRRSARSSPDHQYLAGSALSIPLA